MLSLPISDKIYYNVDYAKYKGVNQADLDVDSNYQIEYLNSLRFPGFPVDDLK